jgi:hypothetical protein
MTFKQESTRVQINNKRLIAIKIEIKLMKAQEYLNQQQQQLTQKALKIFSIRSGCVKFFWKFTLF